MHILLDAVIFRLFPQILDFGRHLAAGNSSTAGRSADSRFGPQEPPDTLTDPPGKAQSINLV